MELLRFTSNGYEIAEIISDDVVLKTPQDALDIMANAQYQGAEHVLMNEINITAEFFDLRTGLAGEILQKYSNYQMKLSIIGNFEKFESKSLQAFMIESNRGRQVAFVPSREAALDRLEI